MFATNLYTKSKHKVQEKEYELYIYIGVASPYYVLNKVSYNIEDVDEGHRCYHYLIDGQLYNGFYTTEGYFTSKKAIQLSLF